jgi:anaerobic dimethyl sulfoxide reductase subunit B (iron-sulfur subunit)
MQLGFYFDQTRCTGCFTCIVACKDWHDVPAGPASWRRVLTYEKGNYPEVFVTFLSTACYHCAKPVCVAACKAGAITKRPQDGVVVVNREKCLGKDKCIDCLRACPYDAPQFGAEPQAKMQKCDLCADRFAEGRKPICVESCPMEALDAGPLEELQTKYGVAQKPEGIYRHRCGPSIIFNPRKDAKKRPLVAVEVAPERDLGSIENWNKKPLYRQPA